MKENKLYTEIQKNITKIIRKQRQRQEKCLV